MTKKITPPGEDPALLLLVERRQWVRESIVLLDGEILIAQMAQAKTPMLIHALIGQMQGLQAAIELQLQELV